jgi:hypothetical protein
MINIKKITFRQTKVKKLLCARVRLMTIETRKEGASRKGITCAEKEEKTHIMADNLVDILVSISYNKSNEK